MTSAPRRRTVSLAPPPVTTSSPPASSCTHRNAIRASRDGVIASVEVADGQRVQYGNVLFKYE
mgnify:CR=1 FL=1